jgi:hypothetical protein
MDWNAAIERNREALKRVLAALAAMAGLAGGAAFTSPLRGEPAPDLIRGRREASGGVEPQLLPPPGGLTTTDLPTRGRENLSSPPPCRAVSTAPCCACCVRPKPRRGGWSS